MRKLRNLQHLKVGVHMETCTVNTQRVPCQNVCTATALSVAELLDLVSLFMIAGLPLVCDYCVVVWATLRNTSLLPPTNATQASELTSEPFARG